MEIEEALDKALDKIAEVVAAAFSSARDDSARNTLTTSCSNFTTSVEKVSIFVEHIWNMIATKIDISSVQLFLKILGSDYVL